MTALEPRRFLSVSAHIRVLGNETTIPAGQSIDVQHHAHQEWRWHELRIG